MSSSDKGVDQAMLEKISFLGNITGCHDSIEKVLKSSSAMLQTVSGRSEGIVSMLQISGRLDRSTFIKLCPQFVTACLTVLETPKNSKTSFNDRENSYRLLIQLFVQIYHHNAQELIRDLSKPISKFVQQFSPNVPLSEMVFYSKLIEACSKVFSTTISGKKQLLEGLYFRTVYELTKGDFDTVKPYLETLSNGYVKVLLTGNFRNETRFTDSLSKLMNFFEEFLNVFTAFKMSKPVLNFHFNTDFKTEDFFVSTKDSQGDCFTNLKRLYFITCSIRNILQESQSIKMEVPMMAILTLFQSYCNLFKYKSTNDKSLDFVVPVLFENIFIILETLAKVGRRSLFPFTRHLNLIIRLSVEWLNRSEANMFLGLRTKFFSFLNAYFEGLGVGHNLSEDDFKDLMSMVLKNVGAYDTTTKIQLNSTASKSDGGKKKKGDEIVVSGDGRSQNEKRMFVECTKASIQVVSTILRSGMFLMNGRKHLEAYNETVRVMIHTLYEVYRNWITLPLPFQCDECRESLLHSFWLAIDNCPRTVSPPLETCIAFLQFAARLERSPKAQTLIADCQKGVSTIMESKLYRQGVTLPVETVSPDVFHTEDSSRNGNLKTLNSGDEPKLEIVHSNDVEMIAEKCVDKSLKKDKKEDKKDVKEDKKADKKDKTDKEKVTSTIIEEIIDENDEMYLKTFEDVKFEKETTVIPAGEPNPLKRKIINDENECTAIDALCMKEMKKWTTAETPKKKDDKKGEVDKKNEDESKKEEAVKVVGTINRRELRSTPAKVEKKVRRSTRVETKKFDGEPELIMLDASDDDD